MRAAVPRSLETMLLSRTPSTTETVPTEVQCRSLVCLFTTRGHSDNSKACGADNGNTGVRRLLRVDASAAWCFRYYSFHLPLRTARFSHGTRRKSAPLFRPEPATVRTG